MKKEKIEELFNSNADIMNGVRVLFDTDFAQAINQAELEWYRFLQMKMTVISISNSFYLRQELQGYRDEIKNKIKELEK